MVFASIAFSVMASAVYLAKLVDPSVSALMVSFIRVLLNLIILVIPAVFRRNISGLFGDRRPSLWLRGLFGGLSLILFFVAIQSVGSGEATFLQSNNGIFVVLLAPILLSERFSFSALFAVAGSLAGMYLLFDPNLGMENLYGKSIAVISGFFVALSNLMVAKAGKSNTPQTVVFYFCFVALFIHLGYFAFFDAVFPVGIKIWAVIAVVGLSATIGQVYMTKAYQYSQATMVSAVSYLGPVLTFGWSVAFFGQMITPKLLYGCGLILICGVFLPFLRKVNTPPV